MLIVNATPNLYGITLQGDYQDLNELYDSISRYLSFYEVNEDKFPYHEYEFLLSLNYDIRHAYQGDREQLTVDNNASAFKDFSTYFSEGSEGQRECLKIYKNHKNGNLYYSVEILYPLVFHYLSAFTMILDDYYLDSWFDNKSMEMPPEYTVLQAEHDRAQIQLLVTLFWDNISSALGKAFAASAYHYLSGEAIIFPYSLYVQALLHYQLAVYPQLTPEQRKDFLRVSLLEIFGSDSLKEETRSFKDLRENYKTAIRSIESIKDNKLNTFFTFDEGAAFLSVVIQAHDGKLYHDDFDQALAERFGVDVDWDQLEM